MLSLFSRTSEIFNNYCRFSDAMLTHRRRQGVGFISPICFCFVVPFIRKCGTKRKRDRRGGKTGEHLFLSSPLFFVSPFSSVETSRFHLVSDPVRTMRNLHAKPALGVRKAQNTSISHCFRETSRKRRGTERGEEGGGKCAANALFVTIHLFLLLSHNKEENDAPYRRSPSILPLPPIVGCLGALAPHCDKAHRAFSIHS